MLSRRQGMPCVDAPQTTSSGRKLRPWIRNWISIGRGTMREKAGHLGKAGTPNATMVRLISLLAGLAAVAIAAIVPAAWFLVAEARLRGEVEFHAQLYAAQVAQEARQNPAFWNALADSRIKPDLDNVGVAQPP